MAPREVSLATSTALAMVTDALAPTRGDGELEDLLVLRRLVLRPLLAAESKERSLPLVRASASLLGYELLGPSPLPDGEEGVVLRGAVGAKPIALVARLSGVTGLVVEAPRATGEHTRRLALRLAERLQAHAVLLGLESNAGALENATLVLAHAEATWPRTGRAASVLVLRTSASTVDDASLGAWGGEAAEPLASRTAAALATLGLTARRGPLDLATREEAGRGVFGAAPLVAITVDARLLQSGAVAGWHEAIARLAPLAVRDAECGAVALELGRTLGSGALPAQSALLELAAEVAVERSVVAERLLADALARTASRAAIARASSGIFLVVVGRAASGLVAGAFPLAMTVDEGGPAAKAGSLAGCAPALARGGTCRVEGAK